MDLQIATVHGAGMCPFRRGNHTVGFCVWQQRVDGMGLTACENVEGVPAHCPLRRCPRIVRLQMPEGARRL